MPAKVKVTVRKSERMRFLLNPADFIEKTKLADGFMNMCDEMYAEVVDSSPVDQGTYQDSWSSSSKGTTKRYTFTFKNSAAHARFLVYGMDINFRRFIRTSRGYTGHSYRYPDPMRGILHDVRRIMWNYKGKFLEEFQRRRTMFRVSTGRKVTVSSIRVTKMFTAGSRYV